MTTLISLRYTVRRNRASRGGGIYTGPSPEKNPYVWFTHHMRQQSCLCHDSSNLRTAVVKRNVTGYFPPKVKKQLLFLASEHDTTIQNLLAEALNDLFAKNGRPEVAPLEKND